MEGCHVSDHVVPYFLQGLMHGYAKNVFGKRSVQKHGTVPSDDVMVPILFIHVYVLYIVI